MEKNTVKIFDFPVIPLDGQIAFPDSSVSLELLRKCEVKAFEEAYKDGMKVLLLPQKDPFDDEPTAEEFHSVGTVARITQILRRPDNKTRILFVTHQMADVVAIPASTQPVDGGTTQAPTETVTHSGTTCPKSDRSLDSRPDVRPLVCAFI